MSTNYKNIFSPNEELISSEELRAYLQGDLSDQKRNKIEVLLEANPLLADAVDGYSQFPEAFGDLPNNLSSAGSNNTGVIIGTCLVAVFLIGAGTWFFNEGNEPDTELSINEVITEKNTIKEVELVDSIENNDIVQSIFSDTVVQVTIKQKKENVKAKFEPMAKFVSVKKDTFNSRKNLTEILSNTVESIEKTTKTVPLKIEKEFEIYHIKDYKVFDYRGKREEPIKLLTRELGGTTANKENPNSEVENLDPIKKIYYDEYLKEAIILFSQERYKKSGKYFNTILQKYPKDVNALFYNAMSSFYREKYSKSTEQFQMYLLQDVEVFDEDAFFNLALSYLENGEIDKSKITLKQVVVNDGFYAKQAQIILEKEF